MSLTYLGELTIGACVPGVMAPLAAAMADLQARIDAYIGFSANVGLQLPDLVALAQSILQTLLDALQLGISAPSLDLQLAVVADALAIVTLQLELINELFGFFAAAGVHLYAYDGTVGAFGGELTAALSSGLPGGSGSGQHCNALVLATTIGATFDAMGKVFKVV